MEKASSGGIITANRMSVNIVKDDQCQLDRAAKSFNGKNLAEYEK
jgi:hypothetical protein